MSLRNPEGENSMVSSYADPEGVPRERPHREHTSVLYGRCAQCGFEFERNWTDCRDHQIRALEDYVWELRKRNSAERRVAEEEIRELTDRLIHALEDNVKTWDVVFKLREGECK